MFLRDARASAAVPRRPADADAARRCGRARAARRGDGLRDDARRSSERSRAASRRRRASSSTRCSAHRPTRPTSDDAATASPRALGRSARRRRRRSRAVLARRRLRRSAGARSQRSRACAQSRATCSCRRCRAQRFDALVPRLLARRRDRARAPAPTRRPCSCACSRCSRPSSRRSAYLALLIEHPPLLPRLAQLMGASAWAADYLTRHPILLDELLDARVLLAEPDWRRVARRARRGMLAAHAGDAERQMDALRHFQHAQTFRLLAQDLGGPLTVERLADHLSALADIDPRRDAARAAGRSCAARTRHAAALRDHRLRQAGRQGARLRVRPRPRVPVRRSPTARRDARRSATRASRSGINTWLTSTTARRAALRHRPAAASRRRRRAARVERSARSDRYQREQAWTWEHQALTRARFVAGDARDRRGVRSRARRDPAPAARPVRSSRPTSSTCARGWHAGHPNRTRAVRPQARRGRHGRHRVHRAVPRARACARASAS